MFLNKKKINERLEKKWDFALSKKCPILIIWFLFHRFWRLRYSVYYRSAQFFALQIISHRVMFESVLCFNIFFLLHSFHTLYNFYILVCSYFVIKRLPFHQRSMYTIRTCTPLYIYSPLYPKYLPSVCLRISLLFKNATSIFFYTKYPVSFVNRSRIRVVRNLSLPVCVNMIFFPLLFLPPFPSFMYFLIKGKLKFLGGWKIQ